MKAKYLSSGATFDVNGLGDSGPVEATVTNVHRCRVNGNSLVFVYTLEFNYPFVIDAEREVEIR